MTRQRTRAIQGVVGTLLLFTLAVRAADTLPKQIADDEFWKLSDSMSEANGEFQSENLLSNETGFQVAIPVLKQFVKPDGVYFGVGPEQNFTYIAALRPKMAFIIDIRRQNMVEHMMYKALFELSSDRAEFVSRLFSKKRPAGLSTNSTVDELFRAMVTAPRDEGTFAKTLKDMQDLLLKKHQYGLTAEDQSALEHVYRVFAQYGPDINYSSGVNGGGGRGGSTYADLMTADDGTGHQLSYLASEESYRFLRDLEVKNLIVPLTGDFGGPRAIQAVGKYVKDHGGIVTMFYTSNVEQYLFQGADNQGHLNGGGMNFYKNVATLPLDSSSMFIRSGNGGNRGGGGNRAFGAAGRPNYVASIQETLDAFKSGRIQAYSDIFLLSR